MRGSSDPSIRWWWPIYEDIVRTLGIDPAKDEEATLTASRYMLSYGVDFHEVLGFAKELVKGSDIAVVGAHESFLKKEIEGEVIVAADGAFNGLVIHRGVIPEIVVTDFDGVSLALLKRYKPITFAHIHGDNLKRYLMSVPNVIRFVVPTTQTFPYNPMYNFGGFTDGDRAIAMALALGARKVRVYGFNREEIGKFSGKTNPDVKRVKIEIAYRIIDVLREIYGSEVIIFDD